MGAKDRPEGERVPKPVTAMEAEASDPGEATPRLRFKLWLDSGGKAFGDGPFTLLSGVEQTGSLRKAAATMGMSYNKAWRLVREMERRLAFPLLERKVGGATGGGSLLTPEARDLLFRYAAFRREAGDLLAALFEKHFPAGVTPSATSGPGAAPDRSPGSARDGQP